MAKLNPFTMILHCIHDPHSVIRSSSSLWLCAMAIANIMTGSHLYFLRQGSSLTLKLGWMAKELLDSPASTIGLWGRATGTHHHHSWFSLPAGIQTQVLHGCACTSDILLTKPHPHGPSFVHLELDCDRRWTPWADFLLISSGNWPPVRPRVWKDFLPHCRLSPHAVGWDLLV